MNPGVTAYIESLERWQHEAMAMREICLGCGLAEEMKWNIPVYTERGKNIVSLGVFKDYFGLGFFKGSLIRDEYNILSKPGAHTQAGRLMKFTTVQQIHEAEDVIKAYIYEAAEIERTGLKIKKQTPDELEVPEELEHKFKQMPVLREAFYALTPGRRRGYLLYFADAKQAHTRTARIEKYIPMILQGKGITDEYLDKRK